MFEKPISTKTGVIESMIKEWYDVTKEWLEEDRVEKGILSGTWADLGAKKAPTWVPNRSRNGAKMGSKNDQNIRSVFDRS